MKKVPQYALSSNLLCGLSANLMSKYPLRPVHTNTHYLLAKVPYACFQILSVTAIIQGVSRLQGITAGGDFLGLCDQKSSYKHVSDFGRLRSYDRLNLGIEGNDY